MGEIDACCSIVLLISTYYVSTCVVGDLIDDVLNLYSRKESNDEE